MNNEWFNEIIGQVQEEMERLKELSTACEKQEVYYKTMISTHEVTIGQQAIYIGEFEKAKIDSETKAHNQYNRYSYIEELQEIIDEQVTEIKNLQMDVKQLQDTIDQLWGRILGDSESHLTDESLILQYTGVIEAGDTKASGRGMVEYPFNPEGETPDTSVDVSAIYREKYPSVFKPATEDTLFPGNATPEPHPYTSPVREVPVSGRVKVKN